MTFYKTPNPSTIPRYVRNEIKTIANYVEAIGDTIQICNGTINSSVNSLTGVLTKFLG